MLQLPFAQGINMAHNRLQDIVNKLNNTSMEKRKLIIYWVATSLISFRHVGNRGLAQILKVQKRWLI
jgi:hypothetical protein